MIVVGAGASGMTAALVAANEGASVLVLESTSQVGGTSARSSGTLWIPRDTEAAATYLDALVGDKADRAMRQAFLAAGPAMIAYLEEHAGFAFRPFEHHPDYRQELPGAALGVRPLESPPFDGRTLGDEFDKLGWPIPELMLFGGMMVRRVEAEQLMRAAKSIDAALVGARLVARFLADRLRYRRGTRLVLGNALVGRLFKNLLDRKVPIWLSTRVERLMPDVVVQKNGEPLHLRARKGVILAGGGFPSSRVLREKYLPQPVAQHTPAGEGCVGETLRLGQEAGGVLGAQGEDNALWFPSSIGTRRDGSTAVYPHILLDRAKPGLIAVGASGRRFTDEAASYHEFARAMYRTGNIPAWLVCDRRFIWNYGLGMIRPLTPSLRRYLESGYLLEARAVGIDAEALSQTVRRHNEFARTGVDLDFGKGGNALDRANGDPAHRPNPCLGVIDEQQLYALRVEATPMATSLGLRTNQHAQVCNAAGQAIPGLYAVGNDMHSVMGGEYPGPGTQLGPGMTFAYLAAMHAVHEGKLQNTEQAEQPRALA